MRFARRGALLNRCGVTAQYQLMISMHYQLVLSLLAYESAHRIQRRDRQT